MPDEPTTRVLRCADPECRAEFIPRRIWQKYHTPQCRKRHWFVRRHRKQGLSLSCPQCGESLTVSLQLQGSLEPRMHTDAYRCTPVKS